MITVLSILTTSGSLAALLSVAWWAIAALIGLALGRGADANPPIARLLAGARSTNMLPEHRPAAILLNRLWPLLAVTVLAGGLAFLAPQIPGIGSRLRDHLGARVAPPARRGRRDRGARRGALLRAAHLPGAADRSAAHARLQGDATRGPRLSAGSAGAGDTVDVLAGDRVDVPAGETVDVLLVQLGSTEGLRVADEELVGSLRRAGAHVVVAAAARPQEIRTLVLTDLRWARAARRAAVDALARLRGSPPRSVIYSTTTAALLWPLPGAIRFDAAAAANRPGRHGLWQRPLERRRLRQAPLLLPSSAGALAEAGAAVGGVGEALSPERALVVPSPIVRRWRGATGPAPARSATSPRSPTPRTPARRGSTACWRPGGACAGPASGWWSPVSIAKGCARAGSRCPTRTSTSLARSPSPTTAPCCAAHACSCVRPAARSTGSPNWRRSPRGAAWSPLRRPAATSRCRSPARSTRVSWARTSARRCAVRSMRRPATDYAARAAELVEPFTVAAVDRIVARELLPRLLGQ